MKTITLRRQGPVFRVGYKDPHGFTETTVDMVDGDTWTIKDGDEWSREEVEGLIYDGLNIEVRIQTATGQAIGPEDPIEAAIQALKDQAYDINQGWVARRGSIDQARKAGHSWMNLEHAVAYITDCDYIHTPEKTRKEAQKDIAYIEAEEEREIMGR